MRIDSGLGVSHPVAMRFASWAICSVLFIAFTSGCLTRRKITKSDGTVEKEYIITRPLKNKFKD